jgi:hypothetical protein
MGVIEVVVTLVSAWALTEPFSELNKWIIRSVKIKAKTNKKQKGTI